MVLQRQQGQQGQEQQQQQQEEEEEDEEGEKQRETEREKERERQQQHQEELQEEQGERKTMKEEEQEEEETERERERESERERQKHGKQHPVRVVGIRGVIKEKKEGNGARVRQNNAEDAYVDEEHHDETTGGCVTEVMVHVYSDKLLILVSQTATIGTWMCVESQQRPDISTNIQSDDLFSSLNTDVKFVLGRRNEEECLILELLATKMMEKVVEQSMSKLRGATSSTDVEHDPEARHWQCVVSAGLHSYSLYNVRCVVKLFEKLVRQL